MRLRAARLRAGRRPAARRHAAAALAIGAAALLVAAPAGSAKTLRASSSDPTGDARSTPLDLTKLTAKYETTGRLRVSITTAAAIDLRAGGQLVVTFAGKSCKADLFGATADFKDPALPWAYRSRGKAANAKPVNGTGTLSGTTYSATFRSSQLANLKPAYVQAALFPAGTSSEPLDQTDCIALR